MEYYLYSTAVLGIKPFMLILSHDALPTDLSHTGPPYSALDRYYTGLDIRRVPL